MESTNYRTRTGIVALASAVICAFVIALCCANPVVAHAETTYTEGALYYTVADQSITITGYFGKDAEVTVPAAIAGDPVNTIAAGAFYGTAANKVNLPDVVTTVEEGAFSPTTEVVFNYNTSNETSTGGAEGFVPEGSTDKQETTDENGNKVITYTDANGNPGTVISNSDGSITTITTESDGTVIEQTTYKDGTVYTKTTLPDGTVTESTETIDDLSDLEATNSSKLGLIIGIIAAIVVIAAIVIIICVRKKKSSQNSQSE